MGLDEVICTEQVRKSKLGRCVKDGLTQDVIQTRTLAPGSQVRILPPTHNVVCL